MFSPWLKRDLHRVYSTRLRSHFRLTRSYWLTDTSQISGQSITIHYLFGLDTLCTRERNPMQGEIYAVHAKCRSRFVVERAGFDWSASPRNNHSTVVVDIYGRTPTSRAAAVEASWSFSICSICLKISELIPDTCKEDKFKWKKRHDRWVKLHRPVKTLSTKVECIFGCWNRTWY